MRQEKQEKMIQRCPWVNESSYQLMCPITKQEH